MANEDLGTLRYGIEVDTKGVDKGQEAMDSLSNTAEQTGKKIDGAEKSIDKVGKTSEKSAKDVDKLDKSTVDVGLSMRDAIGYATAFAASLGAVAAISAESAKEIQNMARLSGVSVEEFQKLAFGANEAGISAEKLGDIYKDTQDKVGDFLNTGGGELKDYFENIAPRVGQTAEQFRGLSGPEALGLFQQGLEKANLSAAEQIFYLESLANDASLLTPLLADNGRGFTEAGKRADELNVVLSQFQIDELVEVNKAFNELSTTISRGTQSIVADNAEDIIDAIQSVSETIATATEFLNENMDAIKAAATVLGSAAVAYGTYRAAVIAATAAQAAFNIAARANPIGLLVTAVGALSGAFLAMGDNAETAAGKVRKLTGETQALSYVEKQLLATKLEDRALEREKELKFLEDQLVVLKAQRAAETDIQKAGRGNDDGPLEATQRRIEAISEEVKLLKEKAAELKQIEIIGGSGTGAVSSSNAYAKASDDLQKLIDKYNPLLAEQRDLLAEQEKLRESLKAAAKKDIPEITNALDAVGKKLDEVRSKINLKPDSSKPMSIFDVGANTSDDFSDVLVNNLSPKLNAELGVQAKTFGSRLSDEFGKLDWGSYGQNIGDALGQALVSGDSSGLRSSLGGMLSSSVSSSVGGALTSSLTSALGAGAAGFLGPIGGGIAGAVASGLISGKEEVSRSIRIVFEDGVAQAFTNIKYDSMFGGSNKLVGFDFLENEMLNNTLRNATRGIDDLLEDLGRSVEDFSGTFEGADLGEAIEDFTGSYIDAGFGSIEAFQELGESAEQALSRVTSSINDLNDAIRGVVGEGTELAVAQYTQSIGDAINRNQELSVEYWEAAKVALMDLATGITEPLSAAEGDLVRGTESYQRAFQTYLESRYSVGENSFKFGGGNRNKTAAELVDYIDDNQLAESISRLGEGVVVATASFAEELESLIDGGDIKGALGSLTEVIATDSENYAEQIKNLKRDLEGLGFDADISAENFASQYEEALSGVVTPEVLARFANAAVLIEGIESATESLAEQADREFDLLTEYFRELGRDDIADLRDTFVELGDAMTETERSIIKAIAEQERLNDARDDEVDKLGSLLSVLRKAADTELDELRERLDGQIERSSDALKDLRDDINDQIEAEQKRADKELDRHQKEQDATSTAISNAKSLINLLDNAMNTLAERSEDLQATLFKRSFAEISAAIETARNTGELPDSQLIEGAIRSISTAGTGNFATTVEREREALKARILLSELSDLSEDQLTTDERQLLALDELTKEIDSNSDQTIDALEQQLEDAENNHNDLVELLNNQYDAEKERYENEIEVQQRQLDKLNDIDNSFESFEQVLADVLSQIDSATAADVAANSGSSGSANNIVYNTVSDQDIRDFAANYTGDDFISNSEAQSLYDAAFANNVSASKLNSILNELLITPVNVNQWIRDNNLVGLTGQTNPTVEAINNMTSAVSGALGRIEASTTATATALDNVTQGNELTVRTA